LSLKFSSQLSEHTFIKVNLQGNFSKSVVTGISFAGLELFEVFVAVRVTVAIFLDVTPCSLVDRWRFGYSSCCHRVTTQLQLNKYYYYYYYYHYYLEVK
jgi:hypothetical protein